MNSCWRGWVDCDFDSLQDARILTTHKCMFHCNLNSLCHLYNTLDDFFKYVLIGKIFHNNNCGTETKGPTTHISAFMGSLHYLQL